MPSTTTTTTTTTIRLSYAFGCIFAVANARWFKSSHDGQSWEPAKETAGTTDPNPAGWTPKPTAAPAAAMLAGMELLKRDDLRTCGYYSGYTSSEAVVCVGLASCVVNSYDMAVGCCTEAEVTDCNIATTCIDSQYASLYTRSSYEYTIFCESSAFPYCVTYSYDADDLFSGYQAVGCGDTPGTRTVLYEPPGGLSSGSARRSSFIEITNSPTSDISSGSGTSSRSTSTTRTGTPNPQPPNESTTPVGAIVGGAVGGVAGLALIAFGAFFIWRHSKKGNPNQPGAPITTGAYPPPPGTGGGQFAAQPTPPMMMMGQNGAPQQFSGYAPAADNRVSVAAPSYYPQSPTKAPYETVTNASISPSVGSGPQSPGTLYQNPAVVGAAAAPVYTPSPATTPGQPVQQQFSGYSPQQPAQQLQVYSPQGNAAELPTTRADSELRELA